MKEIIKITCYNDKSYIGQIKSPYLPYFDVIGIQMKIFLGTVVSQSILPGLHDMLLYKNLNLLLVTSGRKQ